MTVLTTMESTHVMTADNPVISDLRLVAGHLSFFSGSNAISQKVKARLSFFKGEWFLDQNEGFPYWEDVLVNNPSMSKIYELFRRVISESPGVASLDSLDVSFDSVTRRLSVDFSLITDDGQIVDISPFVVVI